MKPKYPVIVRRDPKVGREWKIGCASTYAAKKQIKSMMDLYPDCEFMIVFQSEEESEPSAEHYPRQE